MSVDPKTGEPVEPGRSAGALLKNEPLRWRWDERLNSSLALWYLGLDSELLSAMPVEPRPAAQ